MVTETTCRRLVRLIIVSWIAMALDPLVTAAEPAGHWALRALRQPPLPAVRQRAWPANPIDFFTLATMEANSCVPSPRADRATLLRRITLDLTGVPPTLSELDAVQFAAAPPGFYEQQVARLLDSPRYGERMAVAWLDAARYADTHGFLIDAHRDMWRWRDWVIDAFNRNLPFDQFTIDQLAGDLLPSPTLDQRIATGFNRNHMINYENGAEPEEYRVEYVADRAVATASVWLGLTMQCARCHDHKYDPVTLREFYQWFAYFNQVPEEGLDGSVGNAAPFIPAPTELQQRRLAEIETRLEQVVAEIARRRNAALAMIATWEPTLQSARAPTTEPRDPLVRVGFDRPDRLATDSKGRPVATTARGGVELMPGHREQAMLFTGQNYVDLGEVTSPQPPLGISLAAWVFPTTADTMDLLMLLDSREKSRLTISLEDRTPTLKVPGGGRGGMVATDAGVKLALRRWQHLAVTWDGTADQEPKWFVSGLPVRSTATPGRQNWSTPAGRWRVGGDGDQLGFRGLLDEVLVFARELTADEVAACANADPLQMALAISAGERSAEQTQLICDRYLASTDEAFRRLAAEMVAVRRQQAELRRSIPTTMVMRELPTQRATFILRRGRFDLPDDEVTPEVPGFLPGFRPEWPRNRLGLAQWLVDPSHPLTARVIVNRLWQAFFGVGLVRTPDDFGLRGESPTHPELLDWLAAELVRSGWDMKRLVRLMVTSETYCQSSRLEESLARRDPENRWLARVPRLRLEAEAVRDLLLSTSGLLDERIGGPSVFPYQPAGLWEEVSFNPVYFSAQIYVPSRGTDLYRRGLYTFWKRTLPPPFLAIFDAPTRETCVNGRGRTNSPLQALALMNETTSVEAARHLAELSMTSGNATVQAKVAYLMRVATARSATLSEMRELSGLWERQLIRFRDDPMAALRLLAVGESPRNERLDPAEHAAWTVVANLVLCLDETITRN